MDWFKETFLPSIISWYMIQSNDEVLLSKKQTDICLDYMEQDLDGDFIAKYTLDDGAECYISEIDENRRGYFGIQDYPF